MKITGLSAQQHDPNRVNVLVDGKYKFSLDIFQITDLGIKVGAEYTDSELQKLEVESQFGKLYGRALEYSLMRPHSSKEVRDYLYRKTLTKRYKSKRDGKIYEKPGISKAVTERVFEKLVDKGYVDDLKFAQFWVENRNQRKGISSRKLQAELAAKGIDRSIVETVVANSQRSDDDELQKMITKKRARYNDDQKLLQYLARQGFSYDDIKHALSSYD